MLSLQRIYLPVLNFMLKKGIDSKITADWLEKKGGKEKGKYMNMNFKIKTGMIAPCGMNCAICMAHLLRGENKCPGCRGDNTHKPASCIECVIFYCDLLKTNNQKYYSTRCEKFPCTRLKNLDKRYRTKYGMSMIENLSNIEQWGIRAFIKNEKKRWVCSECGGLICVHRGYCSACGKYK